MPRTPKSEGAPALASAPFAPDLASLKGADERLIAAQENYESARAALNDAEIRHRALARKLGEARDAKASAHQRALDEQSRPPEAERGVTVSRIGGGDNRANIGLSGGDYVQGVQAGEAARPAASPALAAFNRARAEVEGLEPLVDRLERHTLPEARQAVSQAAEHLRIARVDADALEAAKVRGAAPALLQIDGRVVAAAEALEAARMDAERVREELAAAYGYDKRFHPSILAHAVPAAIAKLAADNPRAVVAPGSGLLAIHQAAFDLET